MNHYPNPIWHHGFHWGIVVSGHHVQDCLAWCEARDWQKQVHFLRFPHSYQNNKHMVEFLFRTHDDAMEFALTWT